MNSDAVSDHEATEHIRLLRKASRTRLTILGIFAVLTWGLWAMLQAGDQRALGITEEYNQKLLELRTKWDIPDKLIVSYSMGYPEIQSEITYLKLSTDPVKILNFSL